MGKKVLIITYYWPPSGGIGVLRCLKFAKYLTSFGWEPIIFTAENAHYPSFDYTNVSDIPADLTVLTCPIIEPYGIYKMLTFQSPKANVNNVFNVKPSKLNWMHNFAVWVRSNFFIPDARALWIKPAYKYLSHWLDNNKVDAIISNGPPHSNTRIATLLKKKYNIPWLADFQDPWTQVDYYQLLRLTPWADRYHHKLEQEAFLYADKLTVVSKAWAKSLEEIGAKNVDVLYWGFDPADYVALDKKLDDKFTLTYFGIMGYDRNPIHLFKAIATLMAEIPSFREDFCLQLIGQIDYSIWEEINKAGVMSCVLNVGSLSREGTLQKAQGSRALLLILNQQTNAEGRIPGKSFEYMALRRPILFIGNKNAEIAKIIASVPGNPVCDYEDYEKIKLSLSILYDNYKNNQDSEMSLSFSDEWSVVNQTKKLAGLLSEMTV
ncbi:glycosyl transferase family 1 [Bacteroidota bacterium]|nr:glycosyl transferase family 1 [Bacteroidota bacterium]